MSPFQIICYTHIVQIRTSLQPCRILETSHFDTWCKICKHTVFFELFISSSTRKGCNHSVVLKKTWTGTGMLFLKNVFVISSIIWNIILHYKFYLLFILEERSIFCLNNCINILILKFNKIFCNLILLLLRCLLLWEKDHSFPLSKM